jgi:phenylacetate-CoA ligase
VRPTGCPDRDQIEAAQLDGLRSLIGKIAESNAFYRGRLRAAGIGSDLEKIADYFVRLAFTLKAEIVEDQLQNPPFGTNLTYPIDRYVRYHQTSGTSGEPIRWLDTSESWSWMVENWADVFRVSGVEPGDRIFFAFSFGPFLGLWTAFEAGTRIGCLCVPGGGMSTSARLKAILENRCTVLCCTPTYAARLGEAALEEDIDLGKSEIRRVMVAGEPAAGIPATRARLEQLWPGARVVDHHGMTEIGPVSVECPARRGVLHILEAAFIPEVIDAATGEWVRPGEEGELVLTNLGRDGSPLLRYRTGDRVLLDDRPANKPCACGRYDMALPGGILGRTDDMVVVRGVNVHPSAVEAVVRRFRAVAEFRVHLLTGGALAELLLDVEPVPDCTDPAELARLVESALRDTFNLRIPVRPVECGALPRFELKARRWVRESQSGKELAHA